MLGRNAAQPPEGVLQVLGERGEALAAADNANILPPAVSEHEMVEPVRERLPGDGDAEAARLGEVRQGHPPRLGALAEDHVLGGSMQGPPLTHPALQGPPDAIVGEALRAGHLQMTQKRHRLNGRIAFQDRHQIALPDLGEGVGNRAAALGPPLGR